MPTWKARTDAASTASATAGPVTRRVDRGERLAARLLDARRAPRA